MGTYKEYIQGLRSDYVGRKVIYPEDLNVYTIVGVDYNGALLIDKPAKFTDTTAVALYMVQLI